MVSGPEDWLVEQPCLDILQNLGYTYLPAQENQQARDGLNYVLLRDECIAALMRINSITEADARAVYQDLQSVQDNEQWFSYLRGNYSRRVEGQAEHKTIHLIDYLNTANNTFTITNQFTVHAKCIRRPDVVVFVNGIPLVVIEAKSPVSYKTKATEAYEQIRQYEQDIPRLFYSNAFNIITDGQFFLYGATGCSANYWSQWKDPWPRQRGDFDNDFERGLRCLLQPERLLDLIAHFIVFEKRDEKTAKKICRYQQFRAVNKIVERVVNGKHRKGLVWHTQGSGKSLTMVMAALKLKKHLNIDAQELQSPNLLILTDRIDLDDQIAKTFLACGLPNPNQVSTLKELRHNLHQATSGLTLLATIFKFEGSTQPIANSGNWIVMVDECHRTQEKDLGAYLRSTLPNARFFGFTGTPVKKSDKDTYANFSPEGEHYLDKYGIDDAVADGATIPIKYMSRMADWQIDPQKLDIVFDQWFANEPEAVVAKLKKSGVTMATLAKHRRRVELIAFDMWTHFKEFAKPDGYKAQIVAIDREAVILYKEALDKVITEDLIVDGMEPKAAAKEAVSYSECVYSSGQEDKKPSDDAWTDALRKKLCRYALPRTEPEARDETQVKDAFGKLGEAPYFLIVCSKLLTGFDAPVESVMYLDNPLKEHNLLQAIARTNRVHDEKKQYGLIVDYIGVTKKLNDALESYRSEDVQNALKDIDELRDTLRAAHAAIAKTVASHRKGGDTKDTLRDEFSNLIQELGTENAWFTFNKLAREFVKAYEALSPDPAILEYLADLKWIAMFLPYATQHFEKREDTSIQNYSGKIRDMLNEHLKVTGVVTLIKLRTLTDTGYLDDFDQKGKTERDIKEAAIRKATELKKVLVEKLPENELQFGPFSERVKEIIERMRHAQVNFAEELKRLEKLSKDLQDEITPEDGPLSKRALGIFRIIEASMPEAIFKDGEAASSASAGANNSKHAQGAAHNAGSGKEGEGVSPLQQLALDIHALYASDELAPAGWHTMESIKKDLRLQVTRLLMAAGLKELWQIVPPKVEEYAVQQYSKG